VTIVRAHRQGRLKFSAQSEQGATAHPRLGEEQRRLDLADTGATLTRHVNALREWPLALLGNRRVLRVLAMKPPTPGAAPGTVLEMQGTICRVRAADGDLILQLD